MRWLAGVACAWALLAVAPSASADGKVLLRSGTQDPATLDPHRFALPGEVQIVSDLFLGLLTLDPEAKPIAGAAESWTVSADGLTWEFRLREGLAWSDGRAMTAADYEWSLRRMLDPATAFPFAARLYSIKNARDVSAGRKPVAELGVRALDPRRLRIELAHPAPYFPEVLASYSSPAPRHLVEARPGDWFRPGVMVSNGPFLLEEWIPNSHARLRRNPRFYDAARVSLDAVVHVHPGDAASALRRFRAGELHVVLVVPPDQLDWARQNLPGELRLSAGFGLEHVAFNVRRPPFNDARVRRAVSLAVDREALTRHVTRAGESPAFGLVPPGATNYPRPARADFAGRPQPERLREARALLAEAGYGSAKPLRFTLTYPSGDINRRVAVALGAMWQAAGIKAELKALELKALVGEIGGGKFDAVRFQWLAGTTDPVSFLERLETGAGAMNQAGWSVPRYDALVREAERTADLARRAALLAQAEALALAEHPVAPLYYYAGRRVVSRQVTGWTENVRGVHLSRWLGLK